MGRLQINTKARPDWLLPKPVVCIILWSGVILLFTGIVLLVLGNYRSSAFTEAGGIFLGLGLMLLLICLIILLYARCIITTEDEEKNRVPWIRPYWDPPRIVYTNEEEGKAIPYDEDSFKPIPNRPVYTEKGYTTITEADGVTNGTAYVGPNGSVPAHNGGQTLTVQRSASPNALRAQRDGSASPNGVISQKDDSTKGVKAQRGGSTSPNGMLVQRSDKASPQLKSASRDQSASPTGEAGSDTGSGQFRQRSGSTGSKTVTFRSPVVTKVNGEDKKEGVISELPPSGKKSNTPTDELDRPSPTPPFPEFDSKRFDLVSGYGQTAYGLPYNPAFPDSTLTAAISEYDLWEPDFDPDQVDSSQDVQMRKGGAGKEFRDDMRRFSNPVKVYLRGNFGLSQVSMYDNVRYLKEEEDEEDEEE